MSIKDTKLWKCLREIKERHYVKKRYKKLSKMPRNDYEEFVCKLYAEKFDRFDFSRGQRMDFENPIDFTQKQQWLNLYDRDPRKSLYTDKYEVRKHIKEMIGEDYLVPLISINGKDCFENVKEIDFNQLPNAFVIKCTHGSHMNVIVPDKSTLSKKDINGIKKQLKKWMKTDYSFVSGLELQYHYIKPRMIIEQYIATNGDLPDYKFFCFSGELKFMWIDTSRFTGHKRTVYDLDFNKAPYQFDVIPEVGDIKKPIHFEEMKKLSLKLCEDFIFVRVDFYEANGKLYFGELTFSSHAGLMPPRPIEYNKILGEYIKIDTSLRDNDYKYRKKQSEK